MTTLQDLLAQKAALDRQIAEMQSGARTEAISKIKSLMTEYGLTVEDFAGGRTPRAKPAKDPSKKVAAKYRDASTGQEWTGRGLQPKWLKAAIADGRTLQDFAV